jgi:Nucleotidyl transferase AbiEii toxin, Type IV TA system
VTEAEPARTAAARRAAELALVRVVHHYGERPEFVVLGGLVPALLCANSRWRHAGTSDVDVQVDLEIAGGGVQAVRLERALRNAEFEPDGTRDWRWTLEDPSGLRATVKFELLADLDDQPAGATIRFDGCDRLGAANLRGTGYAARDIVVQNLRANDHGTWREAEVNVAGLAGFLLAKLAAAHGRHKPKDWYDIAFVLLYNDHGDAYAAAERVLEVFGPPTGPVRTQLLDLQANFADSTPQGTSAYVGAVHRRSPRGGSGRRGQRRAARRRGVH